MTCFRLALFLAFAFSLASQSNLGSISGVVTDSSGALVPAAQVTVTQAETGTTFNTTTNAAGTFLFPSMPPSRYTIEFRMTGFQTLKREFLLDATQKARIDATLQPGQAANTVIEVTGAQPVINTESGDIGKTIETRLLRDMPVKGRSVYQVLQLIPGITARANGTNELDGPGQKYSDSSISGSRPNTNAVTQDGVTTNQASGFSNTPFGALEPIQEVRVLTNAYSAEYGRFSGAQIALQTKSGTNQYHCTGYTFSRNGIFNANRWENNANNRPRQDFNWLQFGGSLGGPIPKLRKKAFFYANYDNETGSNPTYPVATVAPTAIRNGDFNSLNAFGVRLIDPLTRQPFANNTIPASRIDPAAARVVAAIPQENVPGTLLTTSRSGIPLSNYIADTFIVRNPIQTVTSRSDLYPNDRNRLYVSFQFLREGPDTNSTAFSNFLNNARQARTGYQTRLALGYTKLFTPRLSNETLFAYQRYRRVEIPPNAGTDIGQQLGIQNRFGTGMPIVNISGLTGFGRNAAGETIEFPLTMSNYSTYVVSRHTFKFGAAVQRYFTSGLGIPNNVSGNYSFNGDMTSTVIAANGTPSAGGRGNEAYAFADFLLGSVQSAAVDFGLPELARSAYNLGFFVNDDWKVTSKLTLNLGVRYDYETRMVARDNLYSRIDPANGALLVAGRNGVDSRLNLRSRKLNFAPRLGLAYSLNDKTVIRSGFGVFYGTPFTEANQTTLGFTAAVNIPALGTGVPQPFRFSQGINTPGLTAGLSDPFAIYQRSTVTAPFAAGANLAGNEPMPYNMNWNLSVSRQLPFSSVLELAYVANRGVHLPQGIPANAPSLSQAADVNRLGIQPFRPFPTIGAFDAVRYRGMSNYHSLQSKLSRRFTQSLGVDFVFTFSKLTDDATAATGATTSRSLNNAQAPWEVLPIERAVSDFDRTHVMTTAWVWELPFGKGKRYLSGKSLAAKLLGGFQLNGIYNIMTGEPFTINQTRRNLALNNQRPNVTDPNNLDGRISNPTFATNSQGGNLPAFQWVTPCNFNTTNFTCMNPASPFQPSSATGIGNLGRNTLRGPGIWNFDSSLFREFRLREGMNLQFRAEVFNALNARVFRGMASTDITNSNFGLVTGTILPRTFQLSARFNF
jgi:hypothetical protein